MGAGRSEEGQGSGSVHTTGLGFEEDPPTYPHDFIGPRQALNTALAMRTQIHVERMREKGKTVTHGTVSKYVSDYVRKKNYRLLKSITQKIWHDKERAAALEQINNKRRYRELVESGFSHEEASSMTMCHNLTHKDEQGKGEDTIPEWMRDLGITDTLPLSAYPQGGFDFSNAPFSQHTRTPLNLA